MKNINLHIQEAQLILSRRNSEIHTKIHHNQLSSKDKERVLKAGIEKELIMYKKFSIRLTTKILKNRVQKIVGWHIQSDERKKISTKNSISLKIKKN